MNDDPEQMLRIERDTPRFTLAAFMADHWFALFVSIVCAGGIVAMTASLGLNVYAQIVLAAFIITCAVVVLIVEFFRRRAFYRQLEDSLDAISRVNHMTAMFEAPSFLDGRIAYGAIEGLGRLESQEIACISANSTEYRDYIELWVHEAKTPLAAAELILAQMHGEQSDKLSRELERVERQVEQALYYARSTSLGNDYDLAQINLRDTVNVACKKSRRFLIENGVGIKNEVDEQMVVIADRTWLIFVIDQVLTNSAKYGASEIVLSAKVEEEGTPREHTLLCIADDGWGIPASDVPRVFERAFTGVNGRTKGRSTGMGLYIVATLVERMGLSVAIASEEGHGTRIMISFPHDLYRLKANRVFSSK